MPRYHVVTDSAATFRNERIIKQYPLTVVPFTVEVNKRRYHDGVDLHPDDTLRLFQNFETKPSIHPPSVEDFVSIYATLSHTCDGIISVHPSREMSRSWHNARLAAQQVGEGCEVAVIDSRSIGVGQAMLARAAAQMMHDGLDFASIVQRVRHAVDRVFSMYIVESTDYIRHNGIMADERSILSAFLGVFPVLNIEEGSWHITEKVTAASAIVDRLFDFAAEFDFLSEAMIVQNQQKITDETRTLQDKLGVEFPGQHFPFTVYSAALASIIGPTAVGIVILESEMDYLENEKD